MGYSVKVSPYTKAQEIDTEHADKFELEVFQKQHYVIFLLFSFIVCSTQLTCFPVAIPFSDAHRQQPGYMKTINGVFANNTSGVLANDTNGVLANKRKPLS
jgi:hypothetical protein